MARRKIATHQLGDYEINCPFEDPEEAKALWEAFLPSVKQIINKADKDLGKTAVQAGLPEIRGVGVQFRDEVLTAFGEGFSVTFLDKENLAEAAARLEAAQVKN